MDKSNLATFLLGALCGGPYFGWRAAKYHTKMVMVRQAAKKAAREAV